MRLWLTICLIKEGDLAVRSDSTTNEGDFQTASRVLLVQIPVGSRAKIGRRFCQMFLMKHRVGEVAASSLGARDRKDSTSGPPRSLLVSTSFWSGGCHQQRVVQVFD